MMKMMMMLMKRNTDEDGVWTPSLVLLDGFSFCDRDPYGDEHDAAYDDAFDVENGDDHHGGDDDGPMKRMIMMPMKRMSRKMMLGPPALVSLASV